MERAVGFRPANARPVVALGQTVEHAMNLTMFDAHGAPLARPTVEGCRSRNQSGDAEPWILPIPVHIVTHHSQLPMSFLQPRPDQPLVIGFDCEGVDLARYGRLCIMQLAFDDAVYLVDAVMGGNSLMQACKLGLESPYVIKVCHDCKRDSEALYFQYGIKLNNVFDTQIAYTLLKEQHGKKWVPDDYISFVDLLADERYCGVVYDEKEEVRVLLRKDPQFWAHRPWTVMMKRVAADDVRFLLRIYERMVKSLTELSKWRLSVRSSLYCQCFCAGDDCFLGCPLPPPPATDQWRTSSRGGTGGGRCS
uniref:3'-5' exonuclease domain-containing protein n=2 Tax=Physcomitrium patens TaxID=3218 RepID=A0A7I4EHD3_PHYPA